MIEVQDLWKSYGGFHALLGINFNVARGEIVGFCGPNGAGKTTCMKILTGYMLPSRGKVRVGGVDAVESSLATRQMIGYLPENTAALRGHDGPRVPQVLRGPPHGCRRGARGPRIDEVVRPLLAPAEVPRSDQDAEQGLPAARRNRPGAPSRAGSPDPRRADRRPRPEPGRPGPRRSSATSGNRGR